MIGTDIVTPRFLELSAEMDEPRVVEFGTRRWGTDPTHHRHWFPHTSTYTMTDVAAGLDVDVVTDLHALTFDPASFDVAVAVSVWEHLERPWIAAQQVADVLAPGGLAYVATHQSFPIHGYPSDFFRFTTEALEVIFGDAGLDVVVTSYAYPAKLTPPREITVWNPAAPVFLNVAGLWRKPGVQ